MQKQDIERRNMKFIELLTIGAVFLLYLLPILFVLLILFSMVSLVIDGVKFIGEKGKTLFLTLRSPTQS
jgi:hypothetical protein